MSRRRVGLVLGVVTASLVVPVLVTRVTARLGEQADTLGDLVACERYDGLPEGFPTRPDAGMVFVRGGTFVPGSTHGYREERPAGAVRVGDFYIDRTEVTHAQFVAFVRATGYVTRAEREGAAPVFDPPAAGEAMTQAYAWWRLARGASYLYPEGTESAVRPRNEEPVVQVALEDALAYARWLGRDLPTEAEWEYAARAHRDDPSMHRAPRDAAGKPTANFWQGAFPAMNTHEDGFEGRARVGCFTPNAFGLYDTVGNVWEWTREPYRGEHRERATNDEAHHHNGVDTYVIKGGSYLCSSDFCARYRVSARHAQEADMTGVHIGFRTVRRP